ncbi:hypothetical protein EJB05_38164, partial [Eragrostis curvula]
MTICRPNQPQDNCYMLAEKTSRNEALISRMRWLFIESSSKMTLYAAKLVESQLTGPQMFFSKEFSRMLPEVKTTLIMDYEGSDNPVTGTLIKTFRGISRITKGWKKFREEHNLKHGVVYIFNFFRPLDRLDKRWGLSVHRA